MTKCLIDHHAQSALFAAYGQFDSYEAIAPGVENAARVVRVSYKLGGAARRIIVRNLNALKASMASFEESRKAVFRETWPDVDETATITKDADPAKFADYVAEVTKLMGVKEEVELLRLPASVMYGDNDLPNAAVAALEENGLIEEDAADAA